MGTHLGCKLVGKCTGCGKVWNNEDSLCKDCGCWVEDAVSQESNSIVRKRTKIVYKLKEGK